MKLLYFQKEKILAWVAGYTADGNTENVAQIIRALGDNANEFANVAKCNYEDVCTMFVTGSKRFDRHRVFYTRCDIDHAMLLPGVDVWDCKWTLSEYLYPK